MDENKWKSQADGWIIFGIEIHDKNRLSSLYEDFKLWESSKRNHAELGLGMQPHWA